MKKLYVSQSLIDVESRKELLDQAEIPCTIKNQRSAMLGGEVPFAEVFPELWVLQEENFERAQSLLKDWEEAIAQYPLRHPGGVRRPHRWFYLWFPAFRRPFQVQL